MNLFRRIRFWLFEKKKPTVESVSMAVAVRKSLCVCVSGYDITDEQFESLYCAVLEREMYGGHDAPEIIDTFFREHNIKRCI